MEAVQIVISSIDEKAVRSFADLIRLSSSG